MLTEVSLHLRGIGLAVLGLEVLEGGEGAGSGNKGGNNEELHCDWKREG